MDSVRGADRARDDHLVHALARRDPRAPVRLLRRALALVGGRPGRFLELDRRAVRDRIRDPARARARPRLDARRRVVPGRRGSAIPSTSSATGIPPGSSIRHASELPRARRVDVGRAGRGDRRDRRRAARARRGPRRPRRRVHAEHPRDGRGVPRGAARSARSGRRPPPSSASAASSTASPRSSRRCCSPSTATATAGATSTSATALREIAAGIPSLERVVAFGYLSGDRVAGPGSLGAGAERRSSLSRCRSTTRSGCSTAPARPGCRSRSSTATAGSCSSISRRATCTSMPRPATGCSGSRRPAG